MPELDDQQLLRYSRQIMLPQIGTDRQEQLLRSSVLIVGVGGLGSPAAMYLAASGVGKLILADDDAVNLSNLQRQIVHSTGDIGVLKVRSAEARLAGLNPGVTVVALAERMQHEELARLAAQCDAVVDASDNFETRYAVNRACWEAGTPLVSGAAIRMEGQIGTFVPSDPDSPCYQCLYPDGGGVDASCVENGILSPLTGVIGSLQAIEVLKVLLGIGTALVSRLLLFDAMDMQWKQVNLRKNPGCPVCG